METFKVANTNLRPGDIVHTPAGDVMLAECTVKNRNGMTFWTTAADPKGWGEWSFNLNFDSAITREVH